MFLHLKRSYKLTIKSNLAPAQRRILNDLRNDDTIIICRADKGKAVVVGGRQGNVYVEDSRSDS